MADGPMIGVTIVNYRGGDVTPQCLGSLFAAGWDRLRVVVVDNASPDDSVAAIRAWAEAHAPSPPTILTAGDPPPAGPPPSLSILLRPDNGGFAAGVNAGLALLRRDPEIELFWVLNPDVIVPEGAPAGYAAAAAAAGPGLGLLGGRVLYAETPDLVQNDGGRVRWALGRPVSVNIGRRAADCAPPAGDSLDYVHGSNIIATRAFLDAAGPMPERYFLYYDEIDWALRRGALRIETCDVAIHHVSGATIGSGSAQRRASPLSVYFDFRNRLSFLKRWRPLCAPTAYLFSWALIARMLLHRDWPAAAAAFAGLHRLGPTAAVRRALSDPKAWERVFDPPPDPADWDAVDRAARPAAARRAAEAAA